MPSRFKECHGSSSPIEGPSRRFAVKHDVDESQALDLPSRNRPLLDPGMMPLALAFSALLSACTVGPDYVRPAAPTAPQFKEAKGWKIVSPSDMLDRGPWWSMYRDPKLSWLLAQVDTSNQTIKADVAAYDQAVAVIREAQAGYFPTVADSYTATAEHRGAGSASTSGVTVSRSITNVIYNPAANATWDPDVWGKIRRTVEADAAAAQVSGADLENAKLSEQATLATAYFNLRAEDSLKTLLHATVAAYQKTLDITRNQFKAGYQVTQGDVAAAEALVETTQAQEIAVGVARAQYEHAIAVLIGRPPADLNLAPGALARKIPSVPVSVPSALL
ncbi:MAG TPA: TolC family protein, partial [Methylovirgula sp.]|nr:TolC family protein [Methylovirgula sp.]